MRWAKGSWGFRTSCCSLNLILRVRLPDQALAATAPTLFRASMRHATQLRERDVILKAVAPAGQPQALLQEACKVRAG